MLDRLPPEILSLIADCLPLPSLHALSQISSGLYSAMSSRVHCTLLIRAASEWALDDLNVDRILASRNGRHGDHPFPHTRHVQVTAPICLTRFNRCMYHRIADATNLGALAEPVAHQQFLDRLASQLRQALLQLEPRALRSFRFVSTPILTLCMPAINPY
ncbi:hypothetical protein BDV40DRAFT_306971 [Aspergillus tamarii]|uniref:F-box domain-containing protein n=1 Tax=Aspergillus tamarii TaxID=41984 RepID=A0A5N6UA51_ASPTM|nr:hypothetical protein BDV40DRAFT_306971 [Aspergillus tamarii]